MPKVTTVFGKRLFVAANLCLPFHSVSILSARFTSKANLTRAQSRVVPKIFGRAEGCTPKILTTRYSLFVLVLAEVGGYENEACQSRLT